VNLPTAKEIPDSIPHEPAYVNAALGNKMAMAANNAQCQKGFGDKPDKLRPNSDVPVVHGKSLGSAGHPHNCRECFFLMFHDGGCKAGKDCKYCHEFHPRANPRKNRQHMAKWSLAAECDAPSSQATIPPPPSVHLDCPFCGEQNVFPPGAATMFCTSCAKRLHVTMNFQATPGVSPAQHELMQSSAGYSNSALDIQSRMLKYSSIFQQNAKNIQRFMQEFGTGTADTTSNETPVIDVTPIKMVEPCSRTVEVPVASKDSSSDENFSPEMFDQLSFMVSTDAGSSFSRQVSASTDDQCHSAFEETASPGESFTVEEGSSGSVHQPQESSDTISLRYSEETPTAFTFVAGAHSHVAPRIQFSNEAQVELKEHLRFSVKPPFPEGLNVCKRTGVISGSPLRAQEATEHSVTISIAALGAFGGTTLGMVTLSSCPITIRAVDLLDYIVSPITSKTAESGQIVLTLNKR